MFGVKSGFIRCRSCIVIIFFYYLFRFALKSAVKTSCRNTIPDADEIIIAPTMRFFQWRVAASSPKCHYVGRAYGRSSYDLRSIYERNHMPELPEVEAAITG